MISKCDLNQVNNFKCVRKQSVQNKFKTVHQNIILDNSNKISQLECICYEENVDVVCLMEHWLPHFHLDFLQIHGFTSLDSGTFMSDVEFVSWLDLVCVFLIIVD